MPRGAKKPIFKLRARVIGKVQWNCPFCSHFNTTNFPLPRFRAQCGNRECRRKFALGLRFSELPGGGKIWPPDDNLCFDERALLSRHELDAMPQAELTPWPYKSGGSVNKLDLAED